MTGHASVEAVVDGHDAVVCAGADLLATALDHWEDMQILVEERFGRERLRGLYDELEALGDVIES